MSKYAFTLFIGGITFGLSLLAAGIMVTVTGDMTYTMTNLVGLLGVSSLATGFGWWLDNLAH